MKKIQFLMILAAALILGACSDKSAPVFGPGAEGLKFVDSSNILDENGVTKTLGRGDSVYFAFPDSITQMSVQVTVNDQQFKVHFYTDAKDSAALAADTTGSEKINGNTFIIKPLGGVWFLSGPYTFTVSGMLANGTPINFILSGVIRESGIFPVASNFINVDQSTGFQDIAPNVGTLWVAFDQKISKVEELVVKRYSGEIVANVVKLKADTTKNMDTVSIALQTANLYPNETYTVTGRIFGAAGQNNDINFTFKTAGSDFVPVATNAEISGSKVGQPTFGFKVDGTLWVKFSDSLDIDLSKITWYSPSNPNIALYGAGYNGAINARATIAGDTLKVTPIKLQSNPKNGDVIGFRVVVLNKKGQSLDVETFASLKADNIYIVSTNVQDSLGNYRPFKVTGDSLVVTFSKPVLPSTSTDSRFKINGFGADQYRVTWDTSYTTATIKNVDTLALSTYGVAPAYTYNGNTQFYDITFNVISEDGEIATLGNSAADRVQLHTEYGLALVGSNILDKHDNQEIPVVAAESVKDTINATASLTFTFNRPLDTSWIRAHNADNMFNLEEAGSTYLIPAVITFSEDARTATVDPVDPLVGKRSGTRIKYTVVIAGVPAMSLPKTATGTKLSITFTTDLGVYFVPVNISKLAMTILRDTIHTHIYDSVSTQLNTNAFIPATPSLHVTYAQPAYGLRMRDSVEKYEYRAQRINRDGTKSGWFYSTLTVGATYFDTSSFAINNPSALSANRSNDTISTSLNISGKLDGLKLYDKDVAGTSYTNGLAYFNDSSTIEIQMRAVVDGDGSGIYSNPGNFGLWSNSVTYVDNIAPCDVNHVAKVNMDNVNAFGVSVVPAAPGDAGGINRLTIAAGDYSFKLTFPEDMDITTKPAIVWYSELATTEIPVVNATTSRWTDARTYVFHYTLKAGVNYTFTTLVTGGAYFSVSVAGMKDASGVTIASHGSVGTASTTTNVLFDDANGVNTVTLTDDEVQGSINVQKLNHF